jgi:hypothetical protein
VGRIADVRTLDVVRLRHAGRVTDDRTAGVGLLKSMPVP